MRCLTAVVFLSLLFPHLHAQDTLQNGKYLYRGACQPCHGARGDGDGPAAKGLNPKPKDLTTGWYKFRSTIHGQMPTDEDIARTISEGVHGTTMPAFSSIFNEDEVFDLVEYIKGFTNRFERWGQGDPIPVPAPLPVTQELLAEGKNIYLALKCWDCHGVDGRGSGRLSPELKDDRGNPIKAFDFVRGTYKAGSTDRDVYRTINTGLSGTSMGTYIDAFLFTREEFDPAVFRNHLADEDMNHLTRYFSHLYAKEESQALSQEEREEIANRRRWALVHFVKSLSRKPSILRKIFVENPDFTE